MEGFTITHNRYVGMKESDISREQFWPGLTEERYKELGYKNASQLLKLYNKTTGIPLPTTVVEYGCGDARVLRPMSMVTERAIGLDICDLVLKAAEKNTDAELHNIKSFHEENFADLVYSLQVMQHNTYEQQIAIMKHITRMLNAIGIAIIHFPKIEDKPNYKNHATCMCFNKQQVEMFGSMLKNPIIHEVDIAPDWWDYYLIGGKL